MNAVIYARWSTLEQGKRREGEEARNTLTRQLEAASKFIEQKGWTPLGLPIVDEGRSAYTGDNIKTGELSKLIQRAERGELPADTIIVVEQLDRLTRLPALEVISWLSRMFQAGLKVATADNGQILSLEEMTTNQMTFISTVFDSFRSHGESKRKSDMLTTSWALRRSQLADGRAKRTTSVCPNWLEWNKEKGEFEVITSDDPLKDRGAIVRKIFEWTAEGIGRRAIAERLNRGGYPTWSKRKRTNEGWHVSYIQKLLKNAAVLGDFQPHTRAKGEQYGKPVGDVIRGYYPAVIDAALWEKTRSVDRPVNAGGGRKGAINNLFSGLAKCGSCGGLMRYHNKHGEGYLRKDKNGVPRYRQNTPSAFFTCSNAQRGHACENKQCYNYHRLERGILDVILHLAMDETHFQKPDVVGHLDQRVAAQRRDVQHLRDKKLRAMSLYIESDDPDAKALADTVEERLREQRSALEQLEAELASARGQVSPAEHLKRVVEVRDAINSEDEEARYDARAKVVAAVGSFVSFIRFLPNRQIMVVMGGGAVNFMFDDKGEVLQGASVAPQLLNGLDSAFLSGLAGDDARARRTTMEMAGRTVPKGRRRASA